MVKSKYRVHCADCKIPIGNIWREPAEYEAIGWDGPANNEGDYYMVKDDIWLEAVPLYKYIGVVPPVEDRTQLCIPCLEKRLNRTVVKSDFTSFPINDYLAIKYAGIRGF